MHCTDANWVIGKSTFKSRWGNPVRLLLGDQVLLEMTVVKNLLLNKSDVSISGSRLNFMSLIPFEWGFCTIFMRRLALKLSLRTYSPFTQSVNLLVCIYCEYNLLSLHFCNFGLSWLWPWIRSYGIPSCITHRPLPNTRFCSNWETFCGWTDVWMGIDGMDA